MKLPGGYIVVLEGVDAVGKRTQSLLLSKWLSERGVKATSMSFPDYETPIGRVIRRFLSGGESYASELQHLLFAANRWEKRGEILSHLRSGEAVVINRYTESNLAYGVANGLAVAWLANLEKGLPKSDLVLVLDAPVRSLASRRPGRNKDAYERSSKLQLKAQKAYRELAGELGWKLVDATGSVKDVHEAVLSAVKEAVNRDRGLAL